MPFQMNPDAHPSKRDARRQAAGKRAGTDELSLALIGQDDPRRRRAESSIQRKFQDSFGAHLSHFLPDLIWLGISGELGAVVGVNAAKDNRLFLEQYLDRPVEQAVASQSLTPVLRDQIVEIGNLASSIPGASSVFFAFIAVILNEAGYRWVVCTATPQVASIFERLNFSAYRICEADPTKLESDAAEWGDYYASRPRVMAGDVQLAAAEVMGNPLIAGVLRGYREPVRAIADALRSRRQ